MFYSLIGRPINNCQIYILDQYLQPLPIGIIGEIHIGGDGVARGYLNRPELTAEKFIENPFGEGKLYKTGDSARYLPDGNIEFIGRIDNQVKIRGFRIELGEIEAISNQYSNIKETVIIAKENTLGDKYLAAYVIKKEEVSVKEIRQFLSEKLPEYMIPSIFVFLESFPLTPNGKIDRKALPEPNFETRKEKKFIAPRNETEIKLVQIWQDILGIEKMGINDNFFELGGHSLLAVRLVTQIQQFYEKNIPIATLFQTPTIEKLAQVLHNNNLDYYSSLVPIQPRGSKPPLFCCHGIYGNVMFFRDLALNLGDEQPVYGLQAKGLDGKETPLTDIREMAKHYITEIRRLQPNGPYLLTGFCFGGMVALEIAQQLLDEGEEIGFLGLLNVFGPNLPKKSKINWLKSHWQNLIRLNFQDQVRYIWRRIRWKTKMINLGNNLLAEEERKYTSEKVLYENVLKANRIARRNYIIQPYEGMITLFNTEMDLVKIASDFQRGWGGIALGGLEMYQVLGDHNDILKEPNVKVLAQQLKTCIDNAFIL